MKRSKELKTIRIIMIEKDVTFKDIAKKVGVSPEMVQMTAAGRKKSHRVRKAIAQALDLDISDLFADAA